MLMDARNRGGRPVKDPAVRLSERLSIPVTAETYDDLCRRATAARMTLNEYLREVIRRVTSGGFRW